MARFAGFLPRDATPINGANASDITSTTAVSILAAPSDTSQAYYITSIVARNKTTADQCSIDVRSITTSEVLDVFDLDAPNNERQHTFWPPLVVPTGEGVEGIAKAATGDTVVSINGFLGTPW